MGGGVLGSRVLADCALDLHLCSNCRYGAERETFERERELEIEVDPDGTQFVAFSHPPLVLGGHEFGQRGTTVADKHRWCPLDCPQEDTVEEEESVLVAHDCSFDENARTPPTDAQTDPGHVVRVDHAPGDSGSASGAGRRLDHARAFAELEKVDPRV